MMCNKILRSEYTNIIPESNSRKEPCMLTPCLDLDKCQYNLINKNKLNLWFYFFIFFIHPFLEYPHCNWKSLILMYYNMLLQFYCFLLITKILWIMKSMNMFYESIKLLFWSFRYKHILGCGSFYNTLVSHEPKCSSTQNWF